ncbi:MAG: hypothetical protein FWH57_08080, partial [Oscillospiraceae bacterium]|nr:hypothetical protein [Oscillospiraceae bacterium]
NSIVHKNAHAHCPRNCILSSCLKALSLIISLSDWANSFSFSFAFSVPISPNAHIHFTTNANQEFTGG